MSFKLSPAMERVVSARIALLMKLPFFGNMATRLVLEEVEDTSWCTTAATDGRTMYFCNTFLNKLSDRQIVFLVGHELMHVVYEHCGKNSRGKGLDQEVCNWAMDFVVNATCIDEHIGDYIGKLYSKDQLLAGGLTEIGTLYDKRYTDWTFEQVYEDLINDPRTQTAKNKNSSQDGEGGLGGGRGGFDYHPDGTGENGTPEISESELQSIKNEIREAVLAAVQAVGVGNVPGNIKRLVGDLTEPKMAWQELLTAQIESQVKSDYSYMRMGRRSFSTDIIFPSMIREPKVQATLALDMSGSIGPQEITEFFSEVKGIVEQHASYEIGVLCWDTTVYNYQVFTEDDGDKIMDYQPQGGGGTDLSCVFEFLKENEIEPKQLVVFTDGEIYNWGDPDYCDTLFIVKNKRKIEAPYGETVEYI